MGAEPPQGEADALRKDILFGETIGPRCPKSQQDKKMSPSDVKSQILSIKFLDMYFENNNQSLNVLSRLVFLETINLPN